MLLINVPFYMRHFTITLQICSFSSVQCSFFTGNINDYFYFNFRSVIAFYIN